MPSKSSVRAMKKFVGTCIVTVLTLFGDTSGRADVVVYKESCGQHAYEDWNLTCKIDKNTFENAGLSDPWAGSFKAIQSIPHSPDNVLSFGVTCAIQI
jgi:hypothetical protein